MSTDSDSTNIDVSEDSLVFHVSRIVYYLQLMNVIHSDFIRLYDKVEIK